MVEQMAVCYILLKKQNINVIIFQVNSDLKLRDTYCKFDRLAVTSGGNVLMVTDS